MTGFTDLGVVGIVLDANQVPPHHPPVPQMQMNVIRVCHTSKQHIEQHICRHRYVLQLEMHVIIFLVW